MLSNLILLGPVHYKKKWSLLFAKNVKIWDLIAPETQESFPVTKNVTWTIIYYWSHSRNKMTR